MDQLVMELDGFINCAASLPMILAHPGLDAELALDQVLPRMPFLIHLVVDEQAAVDSLESVAVKDLPMIRDNLVPTAPLHERQVIKSEDDTQVLPSSQRACEDGT